MALGEWYMFGKISRHGTAHNTQNNAAQVKSQKRKDHGTQK